MDWRTVFAASTTLVLVMDPLGNVPLVHSILARFSPARRRAIVLRELFISLAVLGLFLWTGNWILGFLGLTTSTLNLSGGILLFVIAMKMIFPPKHDSTEMPEDPFIVPLAVPMIAGPSSIALLMLWSSTSPEQIVEWNVALLLAWLVTTAIILSSELFVRLLGDRGLKAVERLMGMILVLLAIQMFLDGMTGYLDGLGLIGR
ncbi:MAG: YhgN family NAAT transporter [Candidatus Paceibacterota bacterium]